MADAIDAGAAEAQSPPRRSPFSPGGVIASLRSTIQTISTVLAWIAGLLTLVLMGVVVAEVILRKYFSTTLGGTIEYSEVLLVFIVFGGVAHAQQVGGHVKTELMTSRLARRPAAFVRAGGLAVAAVLLAWTTQATASRGWDSMQSGESRFGIRDVPVWPARLAIPVGLLFLTFEVLFCAIDAFGDRHRPVQDRPSPTPADASTAGTDRGST